MLTESVLVSSISAMLMRFLFDLNTFLRYFLACEYSGNTDMLWQVFMYKQRADSLIYTGPVWDNDLALDNDRSVYPGNQREEWTRACAGSRCACRHSQERTRGPPSH